jgi:hypothetical protein
MICDFRKKRTRWFAAAITFPKCTDQAGNTKIEGGQKVDKLISY